VGHFRPVMGLLTLHIGGLPDFKRTDWAAIPAYFGDRISDPPTIPDGVAVNKSVKELDQRIQNVRSELSPLRSLPFPSVFSMKYAEVTEEAPTFQNGHCCKSSDQPPPDVGYPSSGRGRTNDGAVD